MKMTEQAPPLTRHDLEARIVKRCWEDGALRKEFTADPAGTFVKYLEIPAASLPKIVVHQETPGTWHIVLPAKPAGANELSEADLEKVAAASVIPVPVAILNAAAAAGAVATAGAAISVAVSVVKGW
jgi:hypothetical protein